MNDGQTIPEVGHATAQAQMPQLTRRHLDWVYCLCLRSVRDPALAEDVTQCVFMALLKKSGRIPQEANISGWLFKTARHCCNRALRNDNTRRRHERAAARMRPDAVAVEAPMRDEELIPLLDEQLARLSQADRTALLLRYYERRSLREVGDVLGISDEAAKKRVQRAVEKLRSRMTRRQMPLTSEALTAILADKLVQAAPEKLTAVILAHAAHGATATVTSAGQTKMLAHMSVKGLASGKTALAATGAVLATALVAAGIAVALAGHNRPKAPQKLIISRATTYITSPLGKDGLPDYKLALKQYLMKGITPKNNAAVPAIEIAMQGFHEWGGGPAIHYRKMGAEQLKLLGVIPPVKAVPKFEFIGRFFQEHPPQGYKLPSSEVIGMSGPAYLLWGRIEQGFALDLPWQRSQCFLLSTAMQQNKAATEVMRRASLLPRFYLPYAWNPKRFKPPIAWFLPLQYVTVEAGDCLAYNATLELGSGHPKMCWSDARALYRLAKLAYQQPGFGTRSGNVLLDRFLYVARVLLGQLRGHPRRLARIWKMIHTIPLPPLLGQRYNHVCRLDTLKLLLSCYRHREVPPMQPLVRTLSKQVTPKDIVEHPPADINWNWQFSHINATFDQMRAMAPATAYSAAGKRLRALEYRWSRAEYYIGVLGGWNPGTVGDIPQSLSGLLARNLPLNVRYHNMVLLATGAIEVLSDDQTQRSLVLVKIAYAVEMYRNAHGHYPGKLAALVPAYFKQIPVDPKTGTFAIYVHQGDGYALTFRKWTLHSRWAPFSPTIGEGGPLRIIMPPPPPRKWQKGPFP